MERPRMSRLFWIITIGVACTVPAALRAQDTATPPETVVMKGPSQGAVTLTHKKHAEFSECVSCHHEPKPEKVKTADNQKCSECHTKPAEAPMKTTLRDAFHNAMAKQGSCVDCHIKEAAAGKGVPQKCGDCHKKEEGS